MDLRKGVPLGRTEISQRELGRIEVLAPSTAARRGCGDAAAGELPTSEAVVEALSGGRGGGTPAPQRQAAVESNPAGGIPAEDIAAGAGEVRRGRGRALRADVGGGAFDLGGRADGGCGNLAELDAGGRVVEPGTEAAAARAPARPETAFWGDSADGRQLS